MSTRRILEILEDETDKKLAKVVDVFFTFVDTDKSSGIQKDEFCKLLTILCDDMGVENLTSEENELLFSTLDDDKSGNLDKKEVQKWIRKLFENIVKEE
jgi:Ca2+-binding EF-hand superfamily protein